MSIRRLRTIGLFLFVVLVGASVALTFWTLRAQQGSARVVNLAGRQRMLIQLMALESLETQTGHDPQSRQTLLETADLFEQTLAALIDGGEAPYGDGARVTLPPARSPEILAQLETVRATWQEARAAIRVVLDEEPQSAAVAEAASAVGRLSARLVSQIDEAVWLVEADADRNTARAEGIQFAFLVTASVLLVLVFAITESRLLDPLAQLVQAAERIGREDLTTPVPLVGLREIAGLARALDEMRRKLGDSAEAQVALLQLSRQLLAAKDEQAVSECAVEAALSALHTDFSALVLPDDQGRLLARAVRGWPAELVGRFELGRGDASQTGHTIQHDHPVSIEDYATESAFTVPPIVFEQGIASGLSAPMLLENRVVGAMLVHSRRRRRFGDDEIRLLLLIANQAAVALEKARLFEAERRQLEERTILYAIATIGVEAANVDEMIRRAIQIIEGVLRPDYFGIGLIDEAAGLLRICRSTQSVREERLTIPLGQGVAGRVIATGQPCRIPDVSRDPDYVPVNPGVRSELCVPLEIDQRAIGMINIESARLEAFSEADERLIVAFAGQLATAIEKVRLFEAEQRRTREAETLRQAGAAVVATLRQDEAIERILQQLERVVPYDSASVQLWVEAPARPDEGYLEIVGGRGWPDSAAVVGVRFPVPGDNPNTEVIQQRRPHIVNDAPSEYAAFRESPHSHIRSFLGVPLLVRDRVIGMLAIDSARPHYFTPDHARLVTAFADQVAIAMENARLFEAEQRGRESAAALVEITQVISSSLEPKLVLKQIAQRTALACRADRCTIFLLDEAGEILKPVMSQFADGHADPEQWKIFKATTTDRLDAVPLFNAAVRERRPALLDDAARTDVVPPRWTQPFGVRRMLAVPLVSHDRVIGVMAIDHTDAHHRFTPEQIDLALTIGGQAATSIENAQLYARTQQHLAELRLLHRASQSLNADLSLDAVLNAVADHLIAALDVESCTILSWDSEHDETATLLDRDPESAAQVAVGSRFRVSDHSHYYALLRENRPLAFRRGDPDLSAALGRWLDTYQWRSLLTVPLLTKGRVIGLIELGERRRERDYTVDEIRLAENLASQAAVAIENARLYAEAQRHAGQLRALHEAGRTLASDLRLESILRTLIETAQGLTDAHYGALAVLGAEGNLAHFYTVGLAEAERERIGEPPRGRGLLGVILSAGVPTRVDDLTRDPRAAGFPLHHPVMKSLLGVPVAARGKVIGGLYLTDKANDQPFTQEDEDLVGRLAADAAITIENARLFENVQRMATTDSLTGLHNRHHFFQLAEHEFQRARRYGRPLSVIMLDIDHFKRVNDTYGHAVGDQVLQAVAGRCRETLRDVDHMGRYGGEEFVVLLPESDVEGAHNAAERLRRCVAESPIETGRGPVAVTISLGAAAITEDCPDLAALLDRADAAMYAAKQAGRNRVCG